MACTDRDVAGTDVGLPSGTSALALQLAADAARLAGQVSGRRHEVDADAVLAHLLMPLVVGARPPASAPRPVRRTGFVHDDTSDADAALVSALADESADAEDVACRAQLCFLPVTPYRDWSPSPVVTPTSLSRARRRDPAGVKVLDLTAMWAGPLCTLLLAEWGAAVTTVEPAVRRDGLRGSPAEFAVLDRGKRRVDLDVRDADGRAEFERLVGDADVLVESFSARVMPNLGYSAAELAAINPRLATVSIRVFHPGTAERDWVAYGRGVHATSGLGMHAGRPQAASIAYPDPLTGFAAFAAVLGALGSDGPTASVVSLEATIRPLLAGGDRPLATGDPAVVKDLAGATAGATAAAIHPTR